MFQIHINIQIRTIFYPVLLNYTSRRFSPSNIQVTGGVPYIGKKAHLNTPFRGDTNACLQYPSAKGGRKYFKKVLTVEQKEHEHQQCPAQTAFIFLFPGSWTGIKPAVVWSK